MSLSGGHWYQLTEEWVAKLDNSWSTTLYVHDEKPQEIYDAFKPDGTKVAIHVDALEYYRIAEVRP